MVILWDVLDLFNLMLNQYYLQIYSKEKSYGGLTIDLSASKINTHSSCPFRFACQYVYDSPEIKTPDEDRLFGSAVHQIITFYYDKITNNSTPEEMKTKLEEAFVEGSDYRVEKRKNRVRTIQTNFLNFELERARNGIKKPVFLEKRLEATLFQGLPDFVGIIDAYFEEGIAIDWKTGKNEEMNTSRMVQGKIYEMLLRAHGYKVEQIVFYNLMLGRQLQLPKITDGWVQNIVSQMTEMVNKNRYPKKESGLCEGWCPYILSCHYSDICPWSDL